ncbi:MAG: ABC transporter permease subunit [Planctomycetes bacterium]|nr:ABC transporter permease subunit [Planctomycetota bacterium]
MKSLNKRKIIDRAAHWGIKLGGAAVVIVILALFVFIFLEVYPLMKDANVLEENRYPINGIPVSLGIDEHQKIVYVVYEEGKVDFISLIDGKLVKSHSLNSIENSRITSLCKDNDFLIMGTNDGRVLTAKIGFSVSFEDNKRVIKPIVSEEEPYPFDGKRMGLKYITSKRDEDSITTVSYTADDRMIIKSTVIERDLFGQEERVEKIQDISTILLRTGMRSEIRITSLTLDLFLKNLYLGTSSGDLIWIDVSDWKDPLLRERVKVSDQPITALGFLLGDVSLVVGDQKGSINVWMQVREETTSEWSLKKIHTLESHSSAILSIVSSMRNKGFVTMASDGSIHLNHATSEQTLLRLNVKTIPSALAFSPKSNGILVAGSSNEFMHWRISNPHPETTLKTLFGRVWYEGYEKPEFVWQSTGGSDDFEPKLSLVPLIFGTIKGTLYAMIFAVPVAILAALYTSQFLHKSLKIIKPVIELMAALPSVILGFLAGLWLAPLMERIFPAILLMPFFILLSIALAFCIWKWVISVHIKGKYKVGIEAFFLIPFILIAIFGSIKLGGLFETFIFMGDYRQWFSDILGLPYDQRNAVVVGFAMGFAVIPIIYTIAEDAMNNVPNNLISASLALGAVPWQTAVRIILPTSSPAIFSAIMIGFGRAVGETMIVLMATGNTPIMDWNFLNGFRALAANIAVEIPEAPFGGTLYRVLFLAALLLFMTTFIVNTLAALVRQRMTRKFSSYG